jgi:HK97 family phage major capsid protein
MPFTVKIDSDADIAGLSGAMVAKAIAERSEMLHTIFEEAGPDLDPSKVKSVELKDGLSLAQHIRERNEELSKLGKRRDELAELEKARENAERERKWATAPARDMSRFAPDDSDGRKAAPAKSLGELVAAQKSYREWAAKGAPGGIDYQFDEVWPTDVMAKSASFDTLGAKTLFQTSAGWAPESVRQPGFVPAVTRPLQLLDILPLARTNQEKIVYMEETTRTHAAAETAEGVAFAESTFVLTERESSVRKITDSIPVTDEQLEDEAQVESYLNSRLVYGLRQRLDGQVLVGSATPPAIRGMKNTPGIQTQAKGADAVPDAIFRAINSKLLLVGRVNASHVLLHPTDWEAIRLLRTADGVYIWGSPSEAGPQRIWSLPVVLQDADSAGTGYVISAEPQWMSLFERRGIDVQVGYKGDQFVEGKRTIRADMRFAFVVFRPAAICQVTGL